MLAAGFTHDATVVRSTVALLHVAAAFLIIDGSNRVARGALRGAGDVRYPAVVGVVTSWVCTPPLCWLLGYRLGLGARGGWLGLVLGGVRQRFADVVAAPEPRLGSGGSHRARAAGNAVRSRRRLTLGRGASRAASPHVTLTPRASRRRRSRHVDGTETFRQRCHVRPVAGG